MEKLSLILSLSLLVVSPGYSAPLVAAPDTQEDMRVSETLEPVLEYVERTREISRSHVLLSSRPAEGALDVYRVVIPVEAKGFPDIERVFDVLYDPQRRIVTAERPVRLEDRR